MAKVHLLSPESANCRSRLDAGKIKLKATTMYGSRTYWSTCLFNIPVTLAHHMAMGWIFYLMVAWLYPLAYCDLKKFNGLVL